MSINENIQKTGPKLAVNQQDPKVIVRGQFDDLNFNHLNYETCHLCCLAFLLSCQSLYILLLPLAESSLES